MDLFPGGALAAAVGALLQQVVVSEEGRHEVGPLGDENEEDDLLDLVYADVEAAGRVLNDGREEDRPLLPLKETSMRALFVLYHYD